MLNVFRRHGEGCSLKRKRRDGRHGKGYCPTKPPCRIYVEGIDGTGKYHPPHVLKDPDAGGIVRDWNRACEIVRAMEMRTPPAPVQKPKTALSTAIAGFLALKAKRDAETQRKGPLFSILRAAPPQRNSRADAAWSIRPLAPPCLLPQPFH